MGYGEMKIRSIQSDRPELPAMGEEIQRHRFESCYRHCQTSGWLLPLAYFNHSTLCKVLRQQLKELLTRYGEICEVWFAGASGGNHYTCGDILDLHNYPGPDLYLYDPMRATVLGEYGGIGLVMKDHLWMPDRNWGYVKFNNPEEVTTEYIKYAEHLLQLIPRGFSAGVYTQITDVEGEVNGLMTYDRKEIKVNEKKIREMNQKICNSLK